ncbi:hypothetical protein FBU59_001417 [Linderina macrospora]|uniref:Uncharacterized protein n=1 Tax=Linderina macrospora TaxID=4868 RepID=A0ACC1JDW9_9FUNG|nr:hypothetical protein FBU59_001417 [Linderina macrospora]
MAGRRKVEPVMLGFSDGAMAAADDTDAFTCKLGGQALWLDTTSEIPSQATTAICQQCKAAMILLVQAYVPLNDSAYDRVLYVWACNRRECSGKAGAARAVRGHLLNRDYAMKLIRSARATKPQPSALGSGLFGSGGSGKIDFGSVWKTEACESKQENSKPMFSGPLFGGNASSISFGNKEQEPKQPEPTDELAEDLEALEIAAPGLPREEWAMETALVPAQYLAIDEEVLETAAIADKYAFEIQQAEESLNDGPSTGKHSDGSGGGEEWSGERYERSVRPQGTDAAFEQFTDIASQNPEQVIRYQFGGTPLFYSFQDHTAQLLNPSSTSPSIDYDDDDDDAEEAVRTQLRKYSTDKLPRCPHCNGKRVFECQLMPAILTVLPLSTHVPKQDTVSEEGGSKEQSGGKWMQALDLGVEFGTMMVFSCENDCHGGKTGTQYLGSGGSSMGRYAAAAYYEECVLVQLESMQV